MSPPSSMDLMCNCDSQYVPNQTSQPFASRLPRVSDDYRCSQQRSSTGLAMATYLKEPLSVTATIALRAVQDVAGQASAANLDSTEEPFLNDELMRELTSLAKTKSNGSGD